MRVVEFIRQIEGEGWAVRQRNGGHLELSHPLADQVVIMSATPSDHRWAENTRARLRCAMAPKPGRAERRIKRRPAPPKRSTPVVVVELPEELPLPLPPRRIAGGPQDWRSPWSRLW
jgi:hypothetical protein